MYHHTAAVPTHRCSLLPKDSSVPKDGKETLGYPLALMPEGSFLDLARSKIFKACFHSSLVFTSIQCWTVHGSHTLHPPAFERSLGTNRRPWPAELHKLWPS